MKLCYHCMRQIQNEKVHICPNCGKSLQATPLPPKFLKPGTVLQGKFILGYPLGAGGFGNTYIGWNRVLLQRVAIKEFYPEQYSGRAVDGITVTVSDERLQPRFQRGLQQFLEEARSVASLQDIRGVVEVSSFFEQNGTGYIVMEYLEGMDVRTILKKSGNKKDYEWSRRVILTVLHTLRDIHRRGVLHRDIAPDNIFVTREGVIKLIDFGAAKHASAIANMKTDVVLKVGYAPIEQYSQTAKQGSYTDLYAVAALFYRMLTGQKPIPANERAVEDTLIPPSAMGIDLPEQAEMAIMVCLNVRPEYRLQSAGEFMEALGGTYFVPVYEPKWILPPSKTEKGIAARISGLSGMAKVAICLAVICLIGGMAAGGIAFRQTVSRSVESLNTTRKEGTVRLEDYTGKSYTETVESLQRQGFTHIAEAEYDFSSQGEGMIMEQSVSPSEEVSVDDVLQFTVSGGETYYTMPDFSGLNEGEARQFFTERNFDVEVHRDPYDKDVKVYKGSNQGQKKKSGTIRIDWQFSKHGKKGVCISQSVEAGKTCEASQNISLRVSMGGTESDFIKKMPELSGKSKKEVEKKLRNAGLEGVLTIQYIKKGGYHPTVPRGNVWKQSFPAGKKINLITGKGKKIKLYLSEGAAPAQTPKPEAIPKPNQRKSPDIRHDGAVMF